MIRSGSIYRMFEIEMSDCVFCGESAGTKEHVFPRWLQKHFGLKDQHLRMANKTKIQYSRVIVPACKNCNSEIFSRLESKVRTGKANDQELFLWALKIRYCLSVLDSNLPNDRSNSASAPILRKEYASIGYDFIKHSFTHLSSDRFCFRPYPFGSVFLLDNPCEDGEFGFVDASHPYWGLNISLPDNKILSVLFTDRGLVKKALSKKNKAKCIIDSLRDDFKEDTSTSVFIQFLAFKLLSSQYQISNIPYGVKLDQKGVYSNKLPIKPKYRKKIMREVVRDIGNMCGIPQEIVDSIYFYRRK